MYVFIYVCIYVCMCVCMQRKKAGDAMQLAPQIEPCCSTISDLLRKNSRII